MPFIFNIDENISKLAQFKSVLIVPCRFCPAASSAVKNNKPYFEFLRKFLKTDSYERYIESLKSNLEERHYVDVRTAEEAPGLCKRI
jgi:hypothetical protein